VTTPGRHWVTLKNHHARPYPILMYGRATKLHWLPTTATEKKETKKEEIEA